MDVTQEVECPVDECSYSDAPALVATHVSSTHDGDHDWGVLPFDGAKEFIDAGGSSTDESTDAAGSTGESAGKQGESAGKRGKSAGGPGDGGADDDQGASTELDDEFVGVAEALAGFMEHRDLWTLEDASDRELVDLYTLFSELEGAAGTARKQVRDTLLPHVPAEGTLASDCGEVARSTRERRTLREEAAVLTALATAGISPQEVMGVDAEKVEKVVESAGVDPTEVFDVETTTYVRKAGVNEESLARLLETHGAERE